MPSCLLKYVPAAKAGPHTQQLDLYDSNSGCRGVVYLPNSDLGIAALKVLELSEAVRDVNMENMTEVQSPEVSPIHLRNVVASRRLSEAHSSPSNTAAGNRRASTSKCEHRDSTTNSFVITELDRARSRIQCNILRDDGVKSNDLWLMALQMLRFCRSLCPHCCPATPKDSAPSPPGTRKENTKFENPDFPLLPRAAPKSFVGYLDPYALPLTPKSPNQITTPKVKAQVPPKLKLPSPLSLANASSNTEAAEAKPYRNALPCGLSEEAWWRIIGSCLGADKVMSKAQQRAVLRWGVDRGTLARETESLGKPESLQMWKVLEGMGCLAYDGGV